MESKPYRIENGILIDGNDNRATISYWGSEEDAAKALASCSDCSGCSDCSDCSGCLRCSDCSDCSDLFPQKAPATVPVIQDIHQKVFAAASQPGCLNMDAWHTCDTTHCRAGWVVTLAGEAGRQLEKATSTLFAAMQIYKASGYPISPVRFYDDNETALADMRRLAEK